MRRREDDQLRLSTVLSGERSVLEWLMMYTLMECSIGQSGALAVVGANVKDAKALQKSLVQNAKFIFSSLIVRTVLNYTTVSDKFV